MTEKNLKILLKKKRTLSFPGTYNAFTAKLIEECGFDGVYISGAGLSNSYGVADDGTLSLDDFVYNAKWICNAVNIPVICDADTGFGNIEETVKKYIEAGLSGMHIEDQIFPKRCGHLEGKEVIPSEEMVTNIKKAVIIKNRINPEFIIIARTDARGAANIDGDKQYEESIKRGKAYLEAGADMIFPESLRSREEFSKYREEIDGLLLANMTEFGKTPFISFREFEKIGYNIVIFPVSMFRYAAGKIKTALENLKETGSQEKLVNEMMTRKDINEILKYNPK